MAKVKGLTGLWPRLAAWIPYVDFYLYGWFGPLCLTLLTFTTNHVNGSYAGGSGCLVPRFELLGFSWNKGKHPFTQDRYLFSYNLAVDYEDGRDGYLDSVESYWHEFNLLFISFWFRANIDVDV